MTKIIEQIINDIEQAPQTFINLTMTADSLIEVFGPMALERKNATPLYGFTDEAIAAVEAGNYQRVIGRNRHLGGSIFAISSQTGDGVKALPLMMRFARAGLITATNYSEGYDLDAWSATPTAGEAMTSALKGTGILPSMVSENIKDILTQVSPTGKSLYNLITKNYK